MRMKVAGHEYTRREAGIISMNKEKKRQDYKVMMIILWKRNTGECRCLHYLFHWSYCAVEQEVEENLESEKIEDNKI